jgi:hypothetical protein
MVGVADLLRAFPRFTDALCARKELFCAGKDFLFPKKDLFCARKEIPFARKDVLSARKDVLSAKKDFFCARKNVLCAGKDLFCARKHLITTSKGKRTPTSRRKNSKASKVPGLQRFLTPFPTPNHEDRDARPVRCNVGLGCSVRDGRTGDDHVPLWRMSGKCQFDTASSSWAQGHLHIALDLHPAHPESIRLPSLSR